MKALIDYIITWLCYGNEEAAHRVAYSADTQVLNKYDVLIIPNGHMGKDIVLPDMQKACSQSGSQGEIRHLYRHRLCHVLLCFASRGNHP